MQLLALISWPYFRKHVLRTLLTIAGIVLGVAVFVGMRAANESVLFAFTRTVDRIAGKTEPPYGQRVRVLGVRLSRVQSSADHRNDRSSGIRRRHEPGVRNPTRDIGRHYENIPVSVDGGR